MAERDAELGALLAELAAADVTIDATTSSVAALEAAVRASRAAGVDGDDDHDAESQRRALLPAELPPSLARWLAAAAAVPGIDRALGWRGLLRSIPANARAENEDAAAKMRAALREARAGNDEELAAVLSFFLAYTHFCLDAASKASEASKLKRKRAAAAEPSPQGGAEVAAARDGDGGGGAAGAQRRSARGKVARKLAGEPVWMVFDDGVWCGYAPLAVPSRALLLAVQPAFLAPCSSSPAASLPSGTRAWWPSKRPHVSR